jgi:hypothetical protein
MVGAACRGLGGVGGADARDQRPAGGELVEAAARRAQPRDAEEVRCRGDRAAVAAGLPTTARNTAGRSPPAVATSSTRARSASKRCAQRTTAGSSEARAVAVSPAALGKAVTPTIGAWSWSTSSSRRRRTSAMRSSTMPAVTAGRNPPTDSTSWK